MKHLNKFKFHLGTATLLFFSILSACKKESKTISNPNSGNYSQGFFVIGEGSYGRSAGAVHFYAYGSDTIQYNAYEKENPGKILANSTLSSTLQFASNINGHLYLISKQNGPIVKVNAKTLKEEGRYLQENSNWRTVIQVNGNQGLISAADGVYQIDLETLSIGYKLNSIAAVNTGEMIKNDSYLFIQQSNGVKIISGKNNYSFVKSFKDISRGFAQTPNGKIWSSNGKDLVAIDENLDTTHVSISASVGSFGYDAPTRLTASTKENAVFYTSGKNIYKYTDGNATSVLKPFITITKDPFMIYGVARYDKNKDQLVVNGLKGYGAESTINYLLIYNASTGELVKEVQYGGDGVLVDFTKISFPALTIFQ